MGIGMYGGGSTGGGGSSELVAYVKDIKANNTNGGSCSATTWNVRDLNDLTGDTSFISLSTNQITLDEGTYRIEGSAPAFGNNADKLRLRNITDSTDTIIGDSNYYSAATIMGVFTIAAQKTFELQHWTALAVGGNGLGVKTNAGVDEVYAQLKITKVSV